MLEHKHLMLKKAVENQKNKKRNETKEKKHNERHKSSDISNTTCEQINQSIKEPKQKVEIFQAE